MARKRILIISQHFWPESFRINDISDFFIENNVDVEVLCGIPNYPKGEFFKGYSFFKNRRQKHKGANIYRTLEIPRGGNSNIRIFLNYISFPLFSIFHLPRLLTKRYDKIFIFQTSPVLMGFVGILLGKIKNIETTMYVLDLWPENLYSVLGIKNKQLRSIIKSISNWHYRHADKLVVLSDRMRNALLKRIGSNKKIIVLPQACEKIYETDIKDTALEKRFSNGFNVVFTGSITPAQSFDTIINAAKLLRKKNIVEINWIIVGDGMSKQWLVDEARKTGLDQNFHFEGLKPIEDIPKYTTIADVLIGCLVKSDLLEATIPSKVMSYIAAGKPIVLAMDGEVQTLINNTIGCGFAGPTNNAKKLADNIEAVYRLTPEQRKELGTKARRYHFKHLERNIILGKLYDFMFDDSTAKMVE